MIVRYLSSIWAALAPAFGNHLWQSTLFVVVVGLPTGWREAFAIFSKCWMS